MRLTAFLALVSLSGCAATVAVPPSATADAAARLDGKRVTVTLADGTIWDANALRLGPDSTSWFDAGGGVMRVVPTTHLAQVTHRDDGRQMKRGAVLGIIAASLYTFAAQSGAGEDGFLSRPFSYQDGGIGPVALSGAVVGAIGSTLLGASDRYVFVPPDPVAVGVSPR